MVGVKIYQISEKSWHARAEHDGYDYNGLAETPEEALLLMAEHWCKMSAQKRQKDARKHADCASDKANTDRQKPVKVVIEGLPRRESWVDQMFVRGKDKTD